MDTNFADRVVQAARGWIGTPYVHQASVRGAGTDCLGLIRGVWRELVGDEPEAMPPYTTDWSEASGHEALALAAGRWLAKGDSRAIARGDIVLFRIKSGAVAKHLGIVSDIDAFPRFIHAYSGHGVVESPFSSPWRAKVAGVFQFPSEG